MSKWLIYGAMILAAALLQPQQAMAKPPEGITLKVKVGYDGFVQQGRINPVIVDLGNTSSGTNLSGELVLRYNDIEYVSKLELPTPSQKRFFLYFPCDNYAPYLTLQVRSKQWTESIDINQFFKSAKAADTSILVIGNQSGSLGVLNQLDTVRLHRNLYENANAAVGSSKTFVGYFKLEEVDPNPKFFARADVIVLADIDYQQVTDELASALKACAAGGTSIVFSLGLNGAGVAASPLAELCPIAVTGTQQVSNLGRLTDQYALRAGGSPATYAVGPLAPGAQVLSDSSGIPAVVRQHWGSGTVTALAFDFTAVPFKQNQQLAALFLDTALSVPENVEVRNWFVHPEPLTKILGRLAEADPMPPQFVLLFLLAYVALIGPVNFLLLRQLKRQTLVWATIPLIIGGFGYAGLETGRITRGSDNVTSTFQEMHVYPGQTYTPYQTVMLVFTAERTRYSLNVPDKSAFLFASIPQQLDQYNFGAGANPARQFRGLTGSQLDNSAEPTVTTTQGKWTSKEYFYQGYAQLALHANATLSANLTAVGAEDPQGTIELDLPFDLESAYLFGAGGTKLLGKVAGRGTYEVGALIAQGKAAPPDSAEETNYLLASRGDISEMQRGASASSLLYRNEILLVGFTDQVEALAKFARPHKDYGLTMVVVHLPFAARNPPDTKAQTRTVIAGGAGFEVNTPWGYGGGGDERLEFAEDGYVDLKVQLLGKAQLATRMTVRVNGEVERGVPVKDLAQHVSLQAWNGSSWREIKLRLDQQALDFALSGLPAAGGVVHLRLAARTPDLKLSMPEVDVYGGASG